jgi:uncharacterized phage protein gp47/JayE
MTTSEHSECECCKSENFRFPMKIYNRSGISQLSYRIGSYSSIRQAMIEQILQSSHLKNWTSRYETDYGMILINTWAYLSDILTFYQERIANEAFLHTATNRDSIIRLASMLDYKLHPGAAATTYLTFELEKNAQVKIPVGLKIQSVPKQGEKPQKFETIESIDAYSSLNVMNPLLTFPLKKGITRLIIRGLHPDLQVGDYILIIGEECRKTPGSEHWDLRQLKSVTVDKNHQITIVVLDKGLGDRIKNSKFPEEIENIEFFVMKNVAWPFGANALNHKSGLTSFYLFSFSADDLFKKDNLLDIDHIINIFYQNDILINKKNISTIKIGENWKIIDSNDNSKEYILEISGERANIYFKLDLTKKNLPEDMNHPNYIILDNIYEDIKPNSWICLKTPDPPLPEPQHEFYVETYLVKTTDKIVYSNYLLTSKVTRLIVDGKEKEGKIQPEHIDYFPIQRTFILGQGKKLDVASYPYDQNDISGDCFKFEQHYPELKSGRNILVKGKISQKENTEASEVVQIENVKSDDHSHTIVTLKRPLQHIYERKTVKIYGNIVRATHGETVSNEILGSGDSSLEFQKFTLNKCPTTFLHAANSPKGIKNTLQVRVGDILWKEEDGFYGQKPDDAIYLTEITDDQKMVVQFGDGTIGARLPTGNNNIAATYRTGLGSQGNIAAYSLTTLLDRPLGVKNVNNFSKAEGGSDTESLQDAKSNIPNTVRTFERAVSLIDYEDLARDFAGIAKAKAIYTIQNEREIIQLIIAGDNGEIIDRNSQTFNDFAEYLNLHRDYNQPVEIIPHDNVDINLKINIKIDPSFLEEKVISEVKNTLFDFFKFDNLPLGQTIHLSNIYRALQQVKGLLVVRIDRLDKEKNLQSLKKHVQIPPNAIATLKDNNLSVMLDLV